MRTLPLLLVLLAAGCAAPAPTGDTPPAADGSGAAGGAPALQPATATVEPTPPVPAPSVRLALVADESTDRVRVSSSSQGDADWSLAAVRLVRSDQTLHVGDLAADGLVRDVATMNGPVLSVAAGVRLANVATPVQWQPLNEDYFELCVEGVPAYNVEVAVEYAGTLVASLAFKTVDPCSQFTDSSWKPQQCPPRSEPYAPATPGDGIEILVPDAPSVLLVGPGTAGGREWREFGVRLVSSALGRGIHLGQDCAGGYQNDNAGLAGMRLSAAEPLAVSAGDEVVRGGHRTQADTLQFCADGEDRDVAIEVWDFRDQVSVGTFLVGYVRTCSSN